MKYFLDTEFLEGPQKSYRDRITKPTIDLISIAIVAEDGREFYEVSRDFNIREAWNRCDLKYDTNVNEIHDSLPYKDYWLRYNVLKPIFDEWNLYNYYKFNYVNFKYCVESMGQENTKIAQEILEFLAPKDKRVDTYGNQISIEDYLNKNKPEFYGYYADYDWVVFCWLFGKMIDLPKGFPMYCIDLKQEEDRIYKTGKYKVKSMKHLDGYPKQTIEHNALEDAKWNYELYKFLEKITSHS